MTLDEVQRAPAVLLAVKRRVDAGRKAGSLLLTGSANLALMGTVAESLAGRAIYLELPPFCPAEWSGESVAATGLDALFAAKYSAVDWPGRASRLGAVGGARRLSRRAESGGRCGARSVVCRLCADLFGARPAAAGNGGSLVDFQQIMRLLAHRTARPLNQSEVAVTPGCPSPRRTVT